MNYGQDIRIIALDPGLHGAIAILKNNTITAQNLPIAGKALDLAALTAIIQDADPSLAVIEKVASMPGQGVTSTFKFGQGYGALLGIVESLMMGLQMCCVCCNLD